MTAPFPNPPQPYVDKRNGHLYYQVCAANGKRRKKYIPEGATEAERERIWRKLCEKAVWNKVTRQDETVSGIVAYKVTQSKLMREFHTAATYAWCHGRIDADEIGAMPASDVKPFMVMDFVRRLVDGRSGTRLTNSSVNIVLSLLRSSYALAVQDGIVTANPVDNIGKLPVKHDGLKFIDLDDGRKLREWARDYWKYDFEEQMLAVAVLLAMATGLRVGEVCGLRKCDFNRDHKDGSRVVVCGTATKGGWTTPKGGEPRTVTVDDETARVLEAWERRVGERYAQTTNLLFPSKKGRIRRTETLSKPFGELCRRLGLSTVSRFHDLRHMHATALLEQGVPPYDVQKRLGHKSMDTMIAHYAHLMPQADRHAAEAYARLWR